MDASRRWRQILADELGPVPPYALRYREASRQADLATILKVLSEGASVALMSDAGTPTISDPGWQLVDKVRLEGYPVVAVPGPCAAIVALSLSGFACRRFSFEGFLPQTPSLKREALARMELTDVPVIVYESPHRLLASLADLTNLEPRPLFIGRELTKKFEESWRGDTLSAASAWASKTIRGEFTLVLGPKPTLVLESDEPPDETIDFVRSLNLPAKTSASIVKHFFPQCPRRVAYGFFKGSS